MPKSKETPPVVKACMWIGGGIGAIWAFIESSSALRDMPGGGGAGGALGLAINSIGLVSLGAIVGGLVGFAINKFVAPCLSKPSSWKLSPPRRGTMKKVAIIVLSLSTACVLSWATYKLLDKHRHAGFYAVQEMGKTLAAAYKTASDAQRYAEAIKIVEIVKPFQIELATVFDRENNPHHVKDAPIPDKTAPVSPEQAVARQTLIRMLKNYNKVLMTRLSHQQWKHLQEIRRRYRTEWLFVDPGEPYGLSPSDLRRLNGVRLHDLLDAVCDDAGLSELERGRLYQRSYEEFDDILASPEGADVNLARENASSSTPTPLLHRMVDGAPYKSERKFPLDKIDKLIKSGADVNLVCDSITPTPLHAALRGGELLLSHRSSGTPS